MNVPPGNARRPIQQSVPETWLGPKGADRWLSNPFAMIGDTAIRRYTLAPDIQSIFQWQ
jgi:hypothetical protein